MARNRKNVSTATRFGPAIRAFLLCLLIGGSGVGFVWHKNQIVELSAQIKVREIQLLELQRRNKTRSAQLASLSTPMVLESRIRQMNLGLIRPPMTQIVRLPDVAVTNAPIPSVQFAEMGALVRSP